MENKFDDGDLAFPRTMGDHDNIDKHSSSNGMTLWDYFAAHGPFKDSMDSGFDADSYGMKTIARLNAAYADAMLEERNKRFGGKPK